MGLAIAVQLTPVGLLSYLGSRKFDSPGLIPTVHSGISGIWHLAELLAYDGEDFHQMMSPHCRMIALSEFLPYLRSLLEPVHSSDQRGARDRYIPTLAELPLQVQTSSSSTGELEGQQKEQYEVMAGLRKYALEHVLLVGKPGSGKSTALRRLLWQEAERCLEAIEEEAEKVPPIPILIELRNLSTSVLDAIRPKLEWWLDLDQQTLKSLLRNKQLLILLDGLNELPNDEAWKAVEHFKQLCSELKVPLIATARELGPGLFQGTIKRLEMLPLTEPQMLKFIKEHLHESSGELWYQIQGQLRELAETPLLLKMLCDVFAEKGKIPQNRGDLFRKEFARRYEEFKPPRLRHVSEESRRYTRDLLSHLAFSMVQGEPHTDPCKPSASWLTVSKTQAEHILAAFLADDRSPDLMVMTKAKEWLEDLLEWHLLQVVNEPEHVEFHHQLFQEYYAAEYLVQKLSQWSDEELKYNYLNYTKWTETISIMLGLSEINPAQVIHFIELALEIDLMLGARLAGEVISALQPNATTSVIRKFESVVPEQPDWLKLDLLEKVGSKAAASQMIPFLNHLDDRIRSDAYISLLIIAPELIPENSKARRDARRVQQILERSRETPELEESSSLDSKVEELYTLGPQILENLVPDVRSIFDDWVSKQLSSEEVIAKLNPIFQVPDRQSQWSVIQVIGSLKSEKSIPLLLTAIEDPSIGHSAAVILGRLGFKSVIPSLVKIVGQHPNSSVRCNAIDALAIIGLEEVIPGIIQGMKDADLSVCERALEASKRFDSEALVPELLKLILHPNSHVSRLAAYYLRILSCKDNIETSLRKFYLQDLVRQIEHQDTWVRWRIAFTLWNVASEEAIPLLAPKLAHRNPDVSLSAALVLGKFGYKEAAPQLIQMMQYSNFSDHPDISEIVHTAAYALRQVESNVAAKYLPELYALLPTASGKDALRAITGIQVQCGFYNYELTISKPSETLAQEELQKSALQPIYQIGSVANFNAGTVHAHNQIGIQVQPQKENS